MSVKGKIIIPVVIITVAVAAAILIINITGFSGYVDTSMSNELSSASRVAKNALESLERQSASASASMAIDDDIINALQSGDEESLLERCDELVDSMGIDIATITDKNGVVLLRSYDPDNKGDSLASRDYVAQALAGNTFSDIAQGSEILLSVRTSSPVYGDNGEIIGTVSTGFRLDTNSFADSVKALVGCEVTVFLADERLSTTVIKADGTRATGTKADPAVSGKVLSGSTYSGTAKILDQDAVTVYTPLLGKDGEAVGMLFVGRFVKEKTDAVNGFIRNGLIVTALILVVCIPLLLLIVTRIVNPIKETIKAARAIAHGDTQITVNASAKDETGELAEAFNAMVNDVRKQTRMFENIADGDLSLDINARGDKDAMYLAMIKMVDNLNSMLAGIRDASEQVSGASRQIADGAQSLAQGSSEQAGAIEHLSKTIGDIAEKTNENAGIAREAAELSEAIRLSAVKGSSQMDGMMAAVKDINEANNQISKVMSVIDNIAFQTNILALNAAVEAAHAGQHGAGFAVVAEEVRMLAEKSAEAASDTRGLILDSIDKANMGMNIATETAASLKMIVDGINRSSEIAERIASSSDEQAEAVKEINTGIEHVAQVVQMNSATAQQSAAASREMSQQSTALEQLTAQFKLKDWGEERQALPEPKRDPGRALRAPAIRLSSEYGKY